MPFKKFISRSAPAHLTTTAKLMEECEESSGQRPRTCFDPKGPLLNPVDEIHESSSSSTLESVTQNQFDPHLEQTLVIFGFVLVRTSHDRQSIS